MRRVDPQVLFQQVPGLPPFSRHVPLGRLQEVLPPFFEKGGVWDVLPSISGPVGGVWFTGFILLRQIAHLLPLFPLNFWFRGSPRVCWLHAGHFAGAEKI